MDSGSSSEPTQRTRLWLLVVITMILGGWALHATGAFMVPVIFSVFFALLVAPLDQWVADKMPAKLGWIGHVAAMGAMVLPLLIFVGLIWVSAQQVVDRFPYDDGSGSLLPQFGDEVRNGSGVSDAATGGQEPAFDAMVNQFGQVFSGAGGSLVELLGNWASAIATQILSAAGATLLATVLVFFLTLIILIEAPNWRQKVVNLFDASAHEQAMDAIGVIGDRLRRYLLARTILGAATAALYAAWLWVFGVDLLIVWFLIAFLLNYIPTLGSLIAGLLPVLYAFVQKDFATAAAVGTGIFVIEQVMGNYVDPRVQGRQVSLSSLVVLVTLLLWGWIWGIAGAILAVPITIAAMIICAHIPSLRPFALMLSNSRDLDGLDRQTGRAER